MDATLYDDNGNYAGELPPKWSFYVPHHRAMLSYNTMEVVNSVGDNGLAVPT